VEAPVRPNMFEHSLTRFWRLTIPINYTYSYLAIFQDALSFQRCSQAWSSGGEGVKPPKLKLAPAQESLNLFRTCGGSCQGKQLTLQW